MCGVAEEETIRMSKRHPGRGGGHTKRRRRHQHHLYLIFDDWLWGYSVRKVDLSSESDSDEVDLRIAAAASGEGAVASTVTGERRLPRAVFRLEAPRGAPCYFTAAFGTKIMAMHPTASTGIHPFVPRCLVPVFDVRKRALDFIPRPNGYANNPIYISVGDRLFALSNSSVELLCASPPEGPGDKCCGRSWLQLPMKPPFHSVEVTSYAVHPDERTIFFSTYQVNCRHYVHVPHARGHGGWRICVEALW